MRFGRIGAGRRSAVGAVGRGLLLAVLAACGHGAVLAPEPQFPPCRELVSVGTAEARLPVRWFGPGQGDEVARHHAWCRAVGPMLSVRRAREAVAVDSVAVVSFNMDLGAGAVAALIDSLRAGAFTGGHPVGDFVLLLQETFREGPLVPEPPEGAGVGRARFPEPPAGSRKDIVATAAEAGLDLFYVPAMRAGRGLNPRGLPEDRGNAILATVPLGDFVMVELPFAGTRRIAHLATATGVNRAGARWTLQLANVHFSVGPIGPSALSAARARQARAMAQVVDTGGAVVLGGDLNAFSLLGTAESVQTLERAFPDSPGGDDLPTRGSQRLDYLFFRGPAGYEARPYRRLAQTFGSDHHPVLGWIRWADLDGSDSGRRR